MRVASLIAPEARQHQQETGARRRWRPLLPDRRCCRLSPPLQASSSSFPLTRRRSHVTHAKGLRLGIGNTSSSPHKRMSDYLLEEGLASGDPTLIEAASAPPTPSALLPCPLPPAPRKASVAAVLRFLGKLAMEDGSLRWRLAVAAALVVASKATGILAPLQLKDAVDALAAEAVVASSSSSPSAAATASLALLPSSFSGALAARPATLRALALFTGSRLLSALTRELKGPLFAPVAAAAARRVAHGTYARVLALELDYHVKRRSGATARVLERGSRAVAMVFRAVAVRLFFSFAFGAQRGRRGEKRGRVFFTHLSSLSLSLSFPNQ